MKIRLCTCGSGLPSVWRNDARGIPLFRTCAKCHAIKMARVRPEVLTNPGYEAVEAIEED